MYCECGCGQKTLLARGDQPEYRKGDPLPFVRGHRQRVFPKVEQPESRFWDKVEKTDGCWEWTASRDRYGYGDFRYGPERGCKRVRAHRFAYEIHNGSIPDGLHVLHRCDNPPCVNPDHLFVGSNADNMADKTTKGRATGAAPGPEHHLTHLTDDDVENIRALRPGHTLKFIGDLFGMTPSNVSHIVNRKTWRHI
jgi:hypothetical protein